MDVSKRTEYSAGVSVSAPATGSAILFGELLADVFPDREVVGGAPFNVACHLGAFGASPLLASRVGADRLGTHLRDAMARFGLPSTLLQEDDTHSSGRVDVTLANGIPHFDIPPDQAFDFVDGEQLVSASIENALQPQLIYFGTLAQRNAVSRAAVGRILSQFQVPVFVDLNLRPPWVDRVVVEQSLKAACFVKMSDDELAAVCGWFNVAATALAERARAVATRFDIERVVVTRGEAGAWCETKEECFAVPSEPVPAFVDTVGAGDAFTATTIFGILSNWPLRVTMQRASAFAAAVCGIPGATPSDPAFYRPFVENWKAP